MDITLGAVNLIKTDNKVCLEIYNQLYKYFEESLNSYPLDVNLTGIFFIDILRLLTGSTLRHREIQHGIVIDHPKLKENLPGWPHIGYGDLINGTRYLRVDRTTLEASASYQIGDDLAYGYKIYLDGVCKLVDERVNEDAQF